MPEVKNVLNRDAAGIILMNAVSIPEGLVNKIASSPGGPNVEVKLTVNGVEVPFEQAVNEAFERWERNFNDYVEKKAKELIMKAHLEHIEESMYNLRNEFENAEWKISAMLREVTEKE